MQLFEFHHKNVEQACKDSLRKVSGAVLDECSCQGPL